VLRETVTEKERKREKIKRERKRKNGSVGKYYRQECRKFCVLLEGINQFFKQTGG
jgi:hypothetical protein